MKINPNNLQNFNVERAGQPSKVSINVSMFTGNGAQAGKLVISGASKKMKSIKSADSDIEIFDAERVDYLKSAISSGQFTVSSEKIADSLIETVSELLRHSKQH